MPTYKIGSDDTHIGLCQTVRWYAQIPDVFDHTDKIKV